jgi:hypothetical protein
VPDWDQKGSRSTSSAIGSALLLDIVRFHIFHFPFSISHFPFVMVIEWQVILPLSER